MLAFLELEEQVGLRWHRLVGGRPSWKSFPEAEVRLDEVRGALSVLFRGLGGASGVVLTGTAPEESGHRLTWRQRLGQDAEKLARPRLDGNALYLPSRIACFPEEGLNRDLYVWLAAYFARLSPAPKPAGGALAADMAALRQARAVTAGVLAECPGLAARHQALAAAALRLRPRRNLPAAEAAVEAAVLRLLGGDGDGGPYWPWIAAAAAGAAPPDPKGYRPFLPVPLWGEAVAGAPVPRGPEGDPAPAGGSDDRDGQSRKGRRQRQERTERKDYLSLNRYEKILALIESLNISRKVDDDDEEGARKALEDADEVVVGSSQGKPATRLRFDLDLPPEAVAEGALAAPLTYPEWHCGKQAYLKKYCRVLTRPAAEEGEDWHPDEETRRRIRQVRRQFEALRPRHELLRAQMDGAELDMEALVRARCDLAASGAGSERVHLAQRRQGRDLAVVLLVDVSLSTDGWIDNRRILDVEKEALTVLTSGLAACGDDLAILTFTSRRRDWVRVETVKDFGESADGAVMRRIAALKPGFYTRIGAAVRHAAHVLEQRPNRHRLLIVLTDGKPNDVDHYEGRYGIEDSRMAVREARRQGISVFGVTVDRGAQDYFPALFGRGGYAIIDRLARLPAALPGLYRHLVS